MNRLRLFYQWALSTWVAIPLGFNDRLRQFCDRCGRTKYLCFWADTSVWESVAGNVNGHHHGAYCAPCFDKLARRKGIRLDWKPEVSTRN